MNYCRHMVNAPLHKAEALYFVYLPEGCYCFPEDRFQWLCAQHLDRLDDLPCIVLIDNECS